MAKKRKLTKEEKVEIKYREGLGRLCRPGCTLIVFGRSYSAIAREGFYESGIRILFTNDVSEVLEMLETAVTLDIPVTLFIRTPFTESPEYFATDVEPLLMYAGEGVDVRIYGHTPHDNVLDRIGIRKDDVSDKRFYDILSKWSPYCSADELGYGSRMKVLAKKERAEISSEKYSFVQKECITVPLDSYDLMEKLSQCAETFDKQAS